MSRVYAALQDSGRWMDICKIEAAISDLFDEEESPGEILLAIKELFQEGVRIETRMTPGAWPCRREYRVLDSPARGDK